MGTSRVFVKTSPASSRRRFHQKTRTILLEVFRVQVLRCLGVQVFRFLGVLVFRVFRVFRVFTCHDISENQKGDQGGGPKLTKISGEVKPGHLEEGRGPKMAKIHYGVKPDIFKYALMASNASCWPTAKRSGIKGSPCSPPSP